MRKREIVWEFYGTVVVEGTGVLVCVALLADRG